MHLRTQKQEIKLKPKAIIQRQDYFEQKNRIYGDVRVQYKKGKNVLQRMRTNNLQGQLVVINTLAQLNAFLAQWDEEFIHIVVEDFVGILNVTPLEINRAIEREPYVPYDRENAIQVISEKINDIREEEQERIREIVKRIRNDWTTTTKAGQGGIFIGGQAGWHIHTDIGTQEHLRYHSGDRKALNTAAAIIEAVTYLRDRHGLVNPYGKECYRWLRYMMIERYKRDLPEHLQDDTI